MKITIVIPAYNEEKYIGRTLESTKKLDKNGWDVDVLVIDGDSTDNTADVAKSFGARIKHEPHKGIGFARQHGIKHAEGDIIAFTDADTIVPKNWLRQHVEILQKPGVVFSYGTYRVADGYFPYYHYVNYVQPHVLWWLHYVFGKPVAAGQNLAFWKEKALSVGGFDENIRVMEDTDLAIRMRKAGKVIFSPDLIVISSGRRSKEGWGFFIRNAISITQYFILGRRSLGGFPDYR